MDTKHPDFPEAMQIPSDSKQTTLPGYRKTSVHDRLFAAEVE